MKLIPKITVIFFLVALFSFSATAQEYIAEGRMPIFSASENYMATVLKNQLRIYNTNDGRIRLKLTAHKKPITTYTVSRNGKVVVTAGRDNKINVWNIESQEVINSFKTKKFPVYHLAVSPNGKYLAIGQKTNLFEEIRIINVETKELMHKFTDSFPGQFQFSKGGKYLVKISNNEIKAWSTRTGTLEKTFKGHKLPIRSFDFLQKSNIFATAGNDKTIKVWDFENTQATLTIQAHNKAVNDVAFFPDGKKIASVGADGKLRVWNTITGNQLITSDIQGYNRQVTIGHNGSLIACAGGTKEYQKVKVYRANKIKGAPEAVNKPNTIVDTDENTKKSTALPYIVWKSPSEVYFESKTKNFKISATVKSEVKITEVLIYINEEEIGASRGFRPVETNYGLHDVEVDIDATLGNGTNVLKIVAKNQAGHIISDTRMVDYGSGKIMPNTKANNYALLFASNEFDHWPNLSNPVPDAEAVADELGNTYNFATEVVTNATTAEVMAKLRQYAKKKYNPNDQLFIFFAGHGHFDEVFGEGYVVGKNSLANDEGKTTYIAHSTLRTNINNIPSEHIFLVMDVCFGGTFDPTLANASHRGGNEQYEDIDVAEFVERKLKYKTRRYLTSGGKEYVPDGRPGQHSPFTRKLLEAMRNSGGEDRILTLNEIISYIEKVNPEPRFGEFGSNEPGSDFLFIAN